MVRYLSAIFITLLILSGCSKKESFAEFRDIPAKGWNRYDTLVFSPTLKEKELYNIDIETRNRADYPYQNIWFFIVAQQDTLTVFSDTIQLTLADKMGKWAGSGWGSLYELTSPYKKSFCLQKSNKALKIKIVQGMRDFDLQGMESVGIRIRPAR